MHKLIVLDRTGHTEIEFAPPKIKTKEAEKSRREAEAVFNEIMGRIGWTVIAMAPSSVEGTALKKFDPNVEESVAIAQVVGG